MKARVVNKLKTKSMWFISKHKNKQESKSHKARKQARNSPESVLFVPYTPNGEFRKIIQEVDDQIMEGRKSGRVKVVERLGSSLLD